MLEVLLIILMVIFLLAFKMYVPTLLIRRAMRPVIERFRIASALDEANAKTLTELDLQPLSFTQRMMRKRDYKPKALEALLSMSIVQTTEDGRLFLSKEKLLASPMVEKWPYLVKGFKSEDGQ